MHMMTRPGHLLITGRKELFSVECCLQIEAPHAVYEFVSLSQIGHKVTCPPNIALRHQSSHSPNTIPLRTWSIIASTHVSANYG